MIYGPFANSISGSRLQLGNKELRAACAELHLDFIKTQHYLTVGPVLSLSAGAPALLGVGLGVADREDEGHRTATVIPPRFRGQSENQNRQVKLPLTEWSCAVLASWPA